MWRPSTHPVQCSSQSKPTAVARENQRTYFESGIFSSNPKENLKERPSAQAKLQHEAPKEHEGSHVETSMPDGLGFDYSRSNVIENNVNPAKEHEEKTLIDHEYTWVHLTWRRRVGKTHVLHIVACLCNSYQRLPRTPMHTRVSAMYAANR